MRGYLKLFAILSMILLGIFGVATLFGMETWFEGADVLVNNFFI